MINTSSKYHDIEFHAIISRFEHKLSIWDPLNNKFAVSELNLSEHGFAMASKALFRVGKIHTSKPFKGIYLFIKDGNPFYVGVSRNVMKRVFQHLKGKSHETSSLCYRIGCEVYYHKTGKQHVNGRSNLDFELYGSVAKTELSKCEISVFEIQEDIDLYLFEVYVAMKMGTLHYNSFRTH